VRLQTSCGIALVLLGVFTFSSLADSASPGSQSKNTEDLVDVKGKGSRKLFSPHITGTYVVSRNPDAGPSRILTIFADGNLSSIQSIQFGGGVAGGGFSNQQGVWKRLGPREIRAIVLDFSYDPLTGNFLGPSVARYDLQFDGTLQNVRGRVTGKVFSPGIDPLNPGEVEPIAEFSDAFQAHRVTAGHSVAEAGGF